MGVHVKKINLQKVSTGVVLLFLWLFISGNIAHGQGYQSTASTEKSLILIDSKGKEVKTNSENESTHTHFIKSARAYNIPTRQIQTFKELQNGYYLVAGVFGEKDNALRFIRDLKNKGLQPGLASNPHDKKHYIYISYHEEGEKAISTVVSELDGLYSKELWIMTVKGAKTPHIAEVTKDDAVLGQVNDLENIKLFKDAAREQGLPVRSVSSLPAVDRGYYLIAGVFGEELNARRQRDRLKDKGIKASYFRNNHKNAFYVYLGHYTKWQEAISQGKNGFNGQYSKTIWILEVQQGKDTATKDRVQHKPQDSLSTKTRLGFTNDQQNVTGSTAIRKSLKDPPIVAKLIEKADGYFDKLWYAEAAELYEMAISKSESPGFEVIRKAGDSHYFNTNMERAYYWYDQLFKNHKDEMSSDNLFKYAHALKGTGKYGRAKRLMRLYNRKQKTEGSDIPTPKETRESREVLLDQMLDTEQQVAIKNLDINSKYSDFGPMFYHENEVVFASAVDSAFFSTRRYKWNNQPYLDLYIAKINEESDQINGAVKFSKKVNSKYHEAGVTFSSDKNTIYFTRNNYGKKLKRDKNGINHLKIYQSTKVDGEWTEAVELPFNSDTYSTGHPALSPDGKQMYFVSDMPGSVGETDIFVVDINEDGSFSDPRNLGPEINTERKEMFPFINESKLYFSSNGHVGLGGLDIFEVAFNDTDGFLEVRNLGRPYNSNQDDFSFIVNEETQKGYFASNRRGGKGDDDIYSFRKPVLEAVNNNAIAGVITEMVSGEVLPEVLVELLDENNRKLKEVVSEEDGSFVFEELDSSTRYIVRSNKPEFEQAEQVVSTLENESVEVAIAMQRLDERIIVEDGVRKLKTDMIYFDFDKSYIRKDAALELDKLVGVMNEYPDMVIRIESHTDSRGVAVYNKYLSDNRAKSTRAYLIKQGISPDRIESAVGYGEERLLNECNGRKPCSEANHQLNRRSEFIIVDM